MTSFSGPVQVFPLSSLDEIGPGTGVTVRPKVDHVAVIMDSEHSRVGKLGGDLGALNPLDLVFLTSHRVFGDQMNAGCPVASMQNMQMVRRSAQIMGLKW